MIPYEHSRKNRLLTQAKMSITSVITIHLCDRNIDYSHPLSPVPGPQYFGGGGGGGVGGVQNATLHPDMVQQIKCVQILYIVHYLCANLVLIKFYSIVSLHNKFESY